MARCFYCADEYSGPQDPEHVLPAAIGADLTTGRVHTECNRRAGREVDQPWLGSPFVADARHRLGVPDRRGRVPKALTLEGEVVGESGRAIIRLEGEDASIRRVPVETSDGETVTLWWYTDEEIETKLQRLRQRDPRYVLSEREVVTPGALSAAAKIEMSVDTWPRFAAKTALAVASVIVSDEDWLDTPEARLLRDVLWNGHPESRQQDGVGVRGLAWSPAPRPIDCPFLLPPEHLLSFEQRPGEHEQFVIVVFGEMGYQLPLALDWSDCPGGLPQSCWFGDGWNTGRWYPTGLQYQLLSSR